MMGYKLIDMSESVVMIVGGFVGTLIVLLFHKESLSVKLFSLIALVGSMTIVYLAFKQGTEFLLIAPLLGVVSMLYLITKEVSKTFENSQKQIFERR